MSVTEWICDECNQLITDPNKGIVIWQNEKTPDYRGFDFKLVHKNISPGVGCDPGSTGGSPYTNSADISQYIGDDGLANLLAFLSLGPLKAALYGEVDRVRVVSTDELADLIRRLQTPGYDAARQSFDKPRVRDDYADANEVLPYLPEQLAHIAKYPDDEA